VGGGGWQEESYARKVRTGKMINVGGHENVQTCILRKHLSASDML
jgi:hypothetical protein